jgi:hypothetical protein
VRGVGPCTIWAREGLFLSKRPCGINSIHPRMAEIQHNVLQSTAAASTQAQLDVKDSSLQSEQCQASQSRGKRVSLKQPTNLRPNLGLIKGSKKESLQFWQRSETIPLGVYKFEARTVLQSESQSESQSEYRYEIQSIPHSEYQYEALKHEKVAVRLLKLLPGPRSHPLKGTLKQFSIKSPGILRPSFDAISYAWVSGYALDFPLEKISYANVGIVRLRMFRFLLANLAWFELSEKRKSERLLGADVAHAQNLLSLDNSVRHI